MLKFRDFEKYDDNDPIPPIVVHCSAGIGRTGTLIALFNIIESLLYTVDEQNYQDVSTSLLTNEYMIKNFKQVIHHPLRISVFGCVRKLREQRMNMVKTFEQYTFIYGFLERWLNKNERLFKSV